MTRQAFLILVVVLLMVGGTAGFLVRLHGAQKLGQPGVRVVAEPTLSDTEKVLATQSVYLPERVLNFASTNLPISSNVVSFLPPDTIYGSRRYWTADGFSVQLNVVLMGTDRTSIHKPEICLVAQGWSIPPAETLTLTVPRPEPYALTVKRILTQARHFKMPDGREEVVRGIYIYWFVADNLLTAEHGERMWWMSRDLIRTGMLDRFAYISFYSVCRPGQEEETFNRMKEFIAASVPEFQLTTGKTVAAAGDK
jgi:hypothetical protein